MLEYNEHYFTMSERYEEMKQQFEVDKELLIYIEKDGEIVAGLTSKNMKYNKITIGVMAVAKSERKKGLARKLVLEFEKRCKERGIKHIDLGARFRACSVYEKLGYKHSLMIQVFDFINIEDVKKMNSFNFEEGFSWQG